MAKLDNPGAIATKWQTKMAGATQAYTDGINAVTEAPGQKAARASGKWLARVTAAQGKFERNVSAVPLSDWKEAATTVGAQRLASGAQKAGPKVNAFWNSFAAYLKAGQARIDAMPTDTFDQAMQKAYAQAQYNMAYPGYR